MLQALIESRKARAFSSPNPNVGAVLVKNNKIISKGHTQIPGKEHAEVMAIKKASNDIKGASLYVTLEPCSHYGRTPPCSDLIIKKKIKNVFIGIKDPHPIVYGKGIKKLKQNNITVITGILKNKIEDELQWYIKTIIKKTPYITLKAGISLDGKTTDYKQNSKWITSEKVRNFSQKLREKNDGILVGINTIIKDNPFLTYRGKIKKPFYKIILDTNFIINKKANVLQSADRHKTIIAIGEENPDLLKLHQLEKKGVQVLLCKSQNGLIDLKDLLKKLHKKNIAKLIIEGGSKVNYSFLKYNLVDKIILFISPILLGGEKSNGWIGAQGFLLNQHKKIEKGKFYNILSDNYIFEGYLHHYVYRYH